MKEYKLKELYTITSGLSKPANQFGIGFPFLSFTTVFNNYHVPEKLINLVNTNIKEQEQFSIKYGDVFITRTSERMEELGKSCVALKDYPKATFNGFCKRLRPKTNLIIPQYAQYLFRSSNFTNQIIYSSPMSTRASLNEQILSTVTLKIHSLNKQQHIIDIIGSIDDKIENNENLILKIKNKLYLYNKNYLLKEKKKMINISEIGNIKYGKSIPTSKIEKNNKYPVYGSNGIIGYLSTYNFSEPKIAISCRGNSSGNIHLTRPKSTITSNSLYLDFYEENYTYFFYFNFIKKGLYEYKTGSAQPQITIENLLKLNLYIPLDLKKYNNYVIPIIEYMYNLIKENNKLIELKKLYLNKFFK